MFVREPAAGEPGGGAGSITADDSVRNSNRCFSKVNRGITKAMPPASKAYGGPSSGGGTVFDQAFDVGKEAMTTLCTDAATVEVRFFRPGAVEVLLAGDFGGDDDWTKRIPMRREPYGWWTLQLRLDPGEYRFRYVADGQWYTDFASNGVEFDNHAWNSVLVVPDRAARVAGEREHSSTNALRVA